MKKISSKILSAFIIISILTVAYNHLISWAAQSKTELNNSLNNTNQKIKDTKNEITEVEQEMSAAMKEVQELVAQISEYETEITELNSQIEETEKNIADTEEKIAKAEKDLKEKEDLLAKRLVALYESGSTTYIDVLLSSQGITDFISNYYLMEELANYDTELIEGIKKTKKENEDKKVELEESKKELESSKETVEAKQNALKVVKADKDSKVANLSAEEKSLEASLTEMENDKKDIYNRLRAIEAEEAARRQAASSGASFGGGTTIISSNPSASGYIFPVAGLSTANIANHNYPSYSGHTGVDVNINVVGRSVVAVKAGTVVTSTALRYSNGNYRSYGEYIIINHHDGTMTLYAHMLAGSRTVSEGQSVSQGQVIGTVGSTGNSSGPHLHFEVRVGGSPVNPFPYLP